MELWGSNIYVYGKPSSILGCNWLSIPFISHNNTSIINYESFDLKGCSGVVQFEMYSPWVHLEPVLKSIKNFCTD